MCFTFRLRSTGINQPLKIISPPKFPAKTRVYNEAYMTPEDKEKLLKADKRKGVLTTTKAEREAILKKYKPVDN
jgi:hypothetical protein